MWDRLSALQLTPTSFQTAATGFRAQKRASATIVEAAFWWTQGSVLKASTNLLFCPPLNASSLMTFSQASHWPCASSKAGRENGWKSCRSVHRITRAANWKSSYQTDTIFLPAVVCCLQVMYRHAARVGSLGSVFGKISSRRMLLMPPLSIQPQKLLTTS